MNKEVKEEEVVEINISKIDQKYIKRVVGNDNVSLEEKIDILTDYFKETEDTIKEWINYLGMSLSPSQFSAAKLHTLKTKQRYIISSAQTASPVNLKFLHNIEKYAKYIDAEIGIIATRYRNPTSLWAEEGDVWDALVHPYLTANRQELHKTVLLLADLKIQATAPNPTSGVELFGGTSSVIVGSPKIEMTSVAVLPGQPQKFLYSTGSVTVPSFTDTVAGGKQAEHHSYGFVIVEIENDEIAYMRSVSADDDGNFNDLIYRIDENGIHEEDVETLVWGDSHFAQKDEQVTRAFRRLCADLSVTKSVLHDVWDSQSINVHNLKNPVIQHQLSVEGKDDLSKELMQMDEELQWFSDNMEETIVVSSNHDDMLDRALSTSHWQDNLKNSVLFVEMLLTKLKGLAPIGLIPYHINKKFTNVKALGMDDSLVRHGVELALHGHRGANGSKGSGKGMARLAFKSIIGHSHTPSINGGCYQVGITCGMKHGYNLGLSGWAYASCTLNCHGKRQMIILNQETLGYTTLY